MFTNSTNMYLQTAAERSSKMWKIQNCICQFS